MRHSIKLQTFWHLSIDEKSQNESTNYYQLPSRWSFFSFYFYFWTLWHGAFHVLQVIAFFPRLCQFFCWSSVSFCSANKFDFKINDDYYEKISEKFSIKSSVNHLKMSICMRHHTRERYNPLPFGHFNSNSQFTIWHRVSGKSITRVSIKIRVYKFNSIHRLHSQRKRGAKERKPQPTIHIFAFGFYFGSISNNNNWKMCEKNRKNLATEERN